MITELIREGFQPYLTSVGGSGLGILSPYAHHRNGKSAASRPIHPAGQVTPPDEVPTPNADGESAGDGNDVGGFDSLSASFESRSIEELAAWTESLGRWLYV